MIGGFAKAAGINSAMEVLRRMVGAEALARFVAGLPPEQAEVILRPPVATSWIPLEITVPLYDAILEQLFAGQGERMQELGRLQFRDDLSTVYRMFIRVATPMYVAERVLRMWETYTRECGTAKVTLSEPTEGELLFSGYPSPNPPIWYYAAGFIVGALELTGASEVRVRVVEGGPGHTYCRYRVSWK